MSMMTEVCEYCGTQYLRPDDKCVSHSHSLEDSYRWPSPKRAPAEFVAFVPAEGHLFRDVGDEILHVCHYGVEFRRVS